MAVAEIGVGNRSERDVERRGSFNSWSNVNKEEAVLAAVTVEGRKARTVVIRKSHRYFLSVSVSLNPPGGHPGYYPEPGLAVGLLCPFDSMGKGLLDGEVQGRFTKKRLFPLARANRSNHLPWDGLRGILRNSPEQPFDSLALIRALGTDS
nr:hypothetical protein COLO4_04086 [Ipomoea batatas]